MASFVVMERKAAGGRDVEFVRDSFQLLAFLLPLFWFLFHRMWIEAAATLALMVGFAALTMVAGYPAHWPLSLIVSILAGLEAPALRLSSMRRAGWQEAGVIEADDIFAAEERYAAEPGSSLFDEAGGDWIEAPAQTAAMQAPIRTQGPALGLFSYPDGR